MAVVHSVPEGVAVWVLEPSFKTVLTIWTSPTGPVKEKGDGKVSPAVPLFQAGSQWDRRLQTVTTMQKHTHPISVPPIHT